MITRLLVANRAEIASRVFRTCRDLGIETVAVHSDADTDLPYVGEADFAVHLPGTAPADTYLRSDLLVDAAHRAGADAIHPGYGFLSENADFARAVIDAGLTWVGPAPESIEAMGSKIEAKRIMRDAGVPTLEAPDQPTEADLPLLVKASAGGGGRGMRVVRRLEDLAAELAAAEAEARSAFGDGTVFVEPYVERGRHVEVQVVGTRVYGDRDCSVQRRHQKVVEEAPAPGLSDEVRAAMHDAARKAAEAIDYRGAGTVEFLYDAGTERFFFLEMNTRLQVEHPVTELVHGVDLVELQIAAAETGSCAPAGGGGRSQAHDPVGHAIEVRLYAEDPAADYQPQTGRLTTFDIPDGPGIRVDTGFASGSGISTHYDAMLAKVIAHGPTRETARRRLVAALRRARIHGVRTNRDQLVAILLTPEFRAGEATTALLSGESAPHGWAILDQALVHAAAAALTIDGARRRTVQHGVPAGWRNVVSAPQVVNLLPVSPVAAEEPLSVAWLSGRDHPTYPHADFEILGVTATSTGLRIDFAWEDAATWAEVVIDGSRQPGQRDVHVDGPLGWAHLQEVPRFTDPADQVASGSLLAPMPGTAITVLVEQGQRVAAGDPVLVLEAMKMQHTVSAPAAGTVTQINVSPGAQVAAGEVLAVVEGDPA